MIVHHVVDSRLADDGFHIIFAVTARCFSDGFAVSQVNLSKYTNRKKLLIARLLNDWAMFQGSYLIFTSL
jgi:hypothetical protein